MVKYLMSRHSNQYPWGMDMAKPWSTMVEPMVWQCLTMVEPSLTMVRLNQATMVSFTFKNKMTMVKYLMFRHSNQYPLGMNMAELWSTMVAPWSVTMVDHGLAMVDHGQATMINPGQFHSFK